MLPAGGRDAVCERENEDDNREGQNEDACHNLLHIAAIPVIGEKRSYGLERKKGSSGEEIRKVGYDVTRCRGFAPAAATGRHLKSSDQANRDPHSYM